MRFPPTGSKKSSRFSSLATLILFVTLVATASQAQTDLTNIEASGSESLKISVKNGPALRSTSAVIFTVNGADMAELDGAVNIRGSIDDSGKKPLLTITNWSDIEDDLETLIEAADASFIPATVEINLEKTKVKLAAKLKTDLSVKMQVGFSFTVNGMNAGKFSLKAVAVEARPPLCEGRTFEGFESFKASVSGVGSVSFNDESATLELEAEGIPFDGMVGFIYTNTDSSPNQTFEGELDFSGKKPVMAFDAASLTDLEENLEELIFDETGFVATVMLGAEKTSFKCGKLGESASISYSAVFVADFGGGEIRTGKLAIKNKMVLVGP